MKDRFTILAVSILIALVAIVHGRIVFNDFTAWDDPQTITENPRLPPPTFESFAHYARQPEAGLYIPVTYGVWIVLARIAFGLAAKATLAAWPFHLASVVVHGAACLLVYGILRTLCHPERYSAKDLASARERDPSPSTAQDDSVSRWATWTALSAAAVFAVHPMQVESVAWASGLKDVLAGALALAAIYTHLRARHVIAAVCFALAMLAKPSAATAIGMVFVIDLFIRRKSIASTALTLTPWMVIAVPLLIVARLVQETPDVPPVSPFQRLVVATDALAFYAFKLVAPLNLAVDYGRPPSVVLAPGGPARVTWLVPVVLAIVIGISRSRIVIASASIFVIGLSLNLGLSPFQFQLHSTVADHYVYLAMLGVCILVAFALQRIRSRPACTFASVVVLALGVLSFRQTYIWHDSITLFRHAIDVNPDSIACRNNLGRILGERGDLDGAEEQFQAVLSIRPNHPEALQNLAVVARRREDAKRNSE